MRTLYNPGIFRTIGIFGFFSSIIYSVAPVDTGRKLSVHKTFRRRPGRLLNVLCTVSLRPVSTGRFLNEPRYIQNVSISRTLACFETVVYLEPCRIFTMKYFIQNSV